jgi:hypothetical protein
MMALGKHALLLQCAQEQMPALRLPAGAASLDFVHLSTLLQISDYSMLVLPSLAHSSSSLLH